MTNISKRPGFTLLEILTALTIFLIIISVVYGSYIATTRSVAQCRIKITQAQEARSILTNISQQLRCCYVPQSVDPTLIANNVPAKFFEPQAIPQVLFEGQNHNSNGIILQFNTTAAIGPASEIPNDLATVSYKHDAENGVLYFRRQIFAPTAQFLSPKLEWKALGDHITDIKLNFLCDDKWLDKWDCRENQRLPEAVKITLYLSDNRQHPAEYSTMIPVVIETTKYTLSKNEKS